MTDEARSADPQAIISGLGGEAVLTEADPGRRRPPVHLWNPPDCGPIPIEIRRDGSWWHDGGHIRRTRMVELFASILRREGERFYLVTPAEKFEITVQDAPFQAVGLRAIGADKLQQLEFRIECDRSVIADRQHPIRVTTDPETGEPSPYIMVRDELEARINRATFYELVELGREEPIDHERLFGVWSCETFFPLGKIED